MVDIEITTKKYGELLGEPELSNIGGIGAHCVFKHSTYEEPYVNPPMETPYAVMFTLVPGIRFIVKE